MANADIYTERDTWSTPLGLSVALHGMLFAAILIYGAVLSRSGASWGGDFTGGDAMSVTLSSNIPLPHPQVDTQNIVANDSKGKSQSEPKAEEKPEPKAIEIPEDAKHPKHRQIISKITPPKPVEQPPNVVPYGQGGPVSGPYGSFSVPNAKGGFNFNSGGGDFGSRFAWYARQVNQKVSQNWLQYEVDPSVGSGHRVYLTFDIDRSGHPSNIQVEQSSGIPSLDISAVRALQRIDTFGPLPNEYSGRYLSVEFWFDYRR